MFAGRQGQLTFLESHYNSMDSRILVLYGRRGVGKTALLKFFLKQKAGSFYAARSCSEREQRYQWARELNESGARSMSDAFPTYRELFQASLSLSAHTTEKHVMMIDEFHHIVKSDDEFMSELIRFAKDTDHVPVLIVLCSSATGWVENSMASKLGRSALSLSGVFKMRELSFQDMVSIFPDYSLEDAMMIYSVLGGNPGLWKSFSPSLSARENIVQNLLTPGTRLYEEMGVYLAEELREPAVYNTLLGAMASGISKLNDLYLHTGFSRAKISVYLKNLMELDLVEKVYSFESKGYENTQKGIYRISNSYVQFYYRFLYPHQSILTDMEGDQFYERYVKDGFVQFLETTYRKICRESLSSEYASCGEWVGKEGSIDLLAKKEDGQITAVLCRYSSFVTLEDYQELQYNLSRAKIKPGSIRIFGEKGFDPRLQNLTKTDNISLERLFHRT